MENNWTINQTKQLFDEVNESVKHGYGLKRAFEKIATATNRSVNSVRNYYYSQLKTFELVPTLAADLGITFKKPEREKFETFTKSEIDELMRKILVGKGKGESVRSVIASMSDCPKQALRLQNKYRSMVAHHKDVVTAIMNDLSEKGVKYYNPYTKSASDAAKKDNLTKLSEFIAKLDDNEVGNFLNLLNKLT